MDDEQRRRYEYNRIMYLHTLSVIIATFMDMSDDEMIEVMNSKANDNDPG